MFDGTLSNNTGADYTIELKLDTKPYHTKPFPIRKVYKPTLKNKLKG